MEDNKVMETVEVVEKKDGFFTKVGKKLISIDDKKAEKKAKKEAMTEEEKVEAKKSLTKKVVGGVVGALALAGTAAVVAVKIMNDSNSNSDVIDSNAVDLDAIESKNEAVITEPEEDPEYAELQRLEEESDEESVEAETEEN